MKKFLVLTYLIFISAFMVGINSFGASEDVYYDLTITDNYTYDLDTGLFTYDVRYAVSNRMILLSNELQVDNNTFHHIIVFGNNNSYIGYYNSIYSSYINDNYLGEFITIEDLPENAVSFAIIIYKSSNNVKLEALNNLTLNEFFTDYNDNSDPEITSIGSWISLNPSQNTVSYVDGEIILEGLSASYGYIGTYKNGVLTSTDNYFTVQRLYIGTSTLDISQVRDNVLLEGDTNLDGYNLYYASFTGYYSVSISLTYEADTVGDEVAKIDFIYAINLSDAGVSGLSDAQMYEYFLQWRYNEDANDLYYDELNGLTLNEVFENGNLFDIDNLLSSWTFNVIGDEIVVQNDTNTSIYLRLYQSGYFIAGNKYYINGSMSVSDNSNSLYLRFAYGGSGNTLSENTTVSYPEDNILYNFKDVFTSTFTGGDIWFYHRLTNSSSTGQTTTLLKNVIYLDLTNLGIDNLTKEQMDEYYDLYTDNLNQEYYSLYLQITSFVLINPYVSREELEDAPSDPDSVIDNILDDGGINDNESRFYIASGVIIAVVIVLAVLHAGLTIILLGGLIPVSIFSFMGWLPLWINIFIVLAGVGLIIKQFMSGGGSSD